MRILGIDPGSRLTGYGCVELFSHTSGSERFRVIDHGTLKLAGTSGKQTIELEERLLNLYVGLARLITELKPQVLAVEKVFFAKNAVSALKLGQARGAVIVCGAIHGLQIVEYSPTEVKQAIVGHGAADKDQVAKVLEMLAGKQNFTTSDASDGLALAVCHAQRVLGQRSAERANSKLYASSPLLSGTGAQATVKKKKKRLSLAESVGLTPVRTSSLAKK